MVYIGRSLLDSISDLNEITKLITFIHETSIVNTTDPAGPVLDMKDKSWLPWEQRVEISMCIGHATISVKYLLKSMHQCNGAYHSLGVPKIDDEG